MMLFTIVHSVRNANVAIMFLYKFYISFNRIKGHIGISHTFLFKSIIFLSYMTALFIFFVIQVQLG